MKKRNLFLGSALALCMFGINTTVNAESYIVDTAPDSFLTNAVGRGYSDGQLTNTENDATFANPSLASINQNVIDYHTKNKMKIFCIARSEYYPINGDVEYTKDDEPVDYAIAYIIANSEAYYQKVGIENVTEDIQKLEQSWFTQIAIWQYQNEKDFASTTVNTANIYEETAHIDSETYYVYSTRAIELWNAAAKLVEIARNEVDPSTSNSNLTVSYDGQHTLDKENKLIKTNMISVDMTNITSYSIDLSKAPNGVKVFTAEGNEITNVGSITSDKIYLTFPIDNVENYTYSFDLSVSSDDYLYYKGYKYISGKNQPVVLVTKEKKTVNGSLNLEGSFVADTASSIANSIYFAGFLILLAGIGIIYANVKQKKQQV